MQTPDTGEPRFWFWAVFSGGNRELPHHVTFGPACHGSGSYTRHDGDRAITLFRYDRHGNRPNRSARLDADGHWRTDERPDRIVWRGSEYGDPVTPGQAGEIAADMGHNPAVIHEAPVQDVRQRYRGHVGAWRKSRCLRM